MTRTATAGQTRRRQAGGGKLEADDACAGSQFKIFWVFDLPEGERPSSMGLVDADDDMAGRQVIDLGAGGGEQCEDHDVDLMETRIGYWLVGDALQTRGPAIWDLSVDNQFDPCVELSWIVVHSKKSEWTVVFFRGTELVEDPAPVVINREPVVERRGTGEVRVDYIYDGHVVDYIVDGDGVRADGVDAVSVERVEFTKANFGSDAPMRCLGNARHSPYDYEIPLEGSETVHFRVPLDGEGSETVNCSAGGMEDFVCEDPNGKRREAADLTSYDAGSTPAGEPANRFVVAMSLPYGAYTESASADLPDSGPVIPADGVTRVGRYAVDIRGPGMTVGDSFTGYHVGISGPTGVRLDLRDDDPGDDVEQDRPAHRQPEGGDGQPHDDRVPAVGLGDAAAHTSDPAVDGRAVQSGVGHGGPPLALTGGESAGCGFLFRFTSQSINFRRRMHRGASRSYP
ncbi:hypothetical protein [Corynebacterium frankenforstense]